MKNEKKNRPTPLFIHNKTGPVLSPEPNPFLKTQPVSVVGP